MAARYAETHRRSLEDPEGFWAEAAAEIDWTKRWSRVLDDSRKPFYRWFPDAELNTCHNALDRHLATRGDQVAVLSGVSPGDEVATSGVFKLRTGAAVHVDNTIQPGNNPAPKPENR